MLAEIRKKHGYNSELYLTPEFKEELKRTLKDQVQNLVDEELKRKNRILEQIVKQFIFEKLDKLVQETLKDAIFVTKTNYE